MTLQRALRSIAATTASTLLVLAPTTSATAGTLVQGNAIGKVVNCADASQPLISVQDNCLVIAFRSGFLAQNALVNGSVTMEFPKGISINKRLSLWSDTSTCTWGGNFAVTKNSKTGGPNVTLSGINCGPGRWLYVAFSASIASGNTISDCSNWVYQSPSTYLSGSYSLSKTGTTYALSDSGHIGLWITSQPLSSCLI